MHEQPQVVAKTVHDDENARVQGSGARQAVRAPGESPERQHDPGGEPLAHRAEQGTIVAQPDRQRPGKREHPLPPGHGRQAVLHQKGSGFGHAPAHTRGVDAATLAGKGDAEAVATALAQRDEDAVLEVAAGNERPSSSPVRNAGRASARSSRRSRKRSGHRTPDSPAASAHTTASFENRRLTATAITDSELAGINNAAASGVMCSCASTVTAAALYASETRSVLPLFRSAEGYI